MIEKFILSEVLVSYMESFLGVNLLEVEALEEKDQVASSEYMIFRYFNHETFKSGIEIFVKDTYLKGFNRYVIGSAIAEQFETRIVTDPPFSYEDQFEWCLITPDGKFYGAYEDDALNANDSEVEDFGISDHLVAIEFDLNED